jgi:DNA-binding transcriptional ArsR family regulator
LAKRGPELIDPRLTKALEHPIRVEILAALREGPTSATRIQRRLDNVSLNLVSHHMKVLKELGCVELVETVNKRGAREHIYRAMGSFVVSDEEWANLTPKMRQPLMASVLRFISSDLARSLSTGRFDELLGTHLSRTPLSLDQEGWTEIGDVLARALDEVIEIGSSSSKRIEESDEAPILATVAILQFQRVDSEAEADRTDDR